MRRLFHAIALILAGCAYPAIAGAVPIDPIIGVRGRDSGSQPSTSNAFFTMGACPSDLTDFFGENVFCLEYDILQAIDEITSLTFQFMSGSGLIPNDVLFSDTSNFNGFGSFQRLEDGLSVRFSSGEFSSLLCIGSDGEIPPLVPCGQGSTIQLYLHVPPNEGDPDPPYQASLRAINDVAVPEPGLLLLMGIGLVLAGRRLRRRKASLF